MALKIQATLETPTQARLLRLKAAAVEVLGEVQNSRLIELLILSSSPSRFRAYLEKRRPAPRREAPVRDDQGAAK